MKRFIQFKHKAGRRLRRLFLKPIKVFCIHQVSEKFEPEVMEECDWMQMEVFKQHILSLKRKCTFVSLPEVTSHLKYDRIRMKRYVCLTADDGFASQKNILTWLEEQKIPITLFLNPLYMDGKHFRERVSEKYLSVDEVIDYARLNSMLFVASHGLQHNDATLISRSEFQQSVEKASEILELFPCFIPYFAYTWGRRNAVTDEVLIDHGLIPVLMDGQGNYNDPSMIHRELLLE